jgi:hypothetical protein
VAEPAVGQETGTVTESVPAVGSPQAAASEPAASALSNAAMARYLASFPPGTAPPSVAGQTAQPAGNAAMARVQARRQRSTRPSRQQRPIPVAAKDDAPVQRAPTKSPAPTEFVPSTKADPAGAASLKLFAHHIHTWNVANWRDAPKGTYFDWGWGVSPLSDVLEIVGDDTDHNGATRLIWVQAKRPGRARIQGTPVHQVPGGPRVVGTTRYADITVEQPTLGLLSLMPRRADGSGAQKDHLSPGDKLIARVQVGNVDGEHMEDPHAIFLTGQGLQSVETAGGAKPVQNFPDGRTYDVELVAKAPGSLDLELELGLGRGPLGRGPKATGIIGEVEMDRQEFLNSASQCNTKIRRAYTRASSIMEVLSAAYGNAYEDHDKTLREQKASDRLVGDFLLNAALAFIPGGVGGYVAGLMDKAKHGNFLVDAVKDLAKAGTKGALGKLAGATRGGEPMTPMAEDPRTWRAEYVVYVNTEEEKVLDLLDGWITKARTKDPAFYLDFDPATTMEAALVVAKEPLRSPPVAGQPLGTTPVAGQPLASTPVPDQKEHQKKFELGMWREWLRTFGYTAATKHAGRAGAQYVVEENQGKDIRNRLNELGVDGDKWLEEYGGVAKRAAEAEVEKRKRARWGG